ncbi:MAG: isocitrate lyase [Candidatus Caldarchaeum sp.]|nr:isocitrate lyase [Candidatus Caldarchaeum sp.]MDW8434950.1 isocitrate lyase [Candidatus Caldarchaeum sp.]
MNPLLEAQTPEELEKVWRTQRWNGIVRRYSAEDVLKLRGTWKIDYTVSRLASEKLWKLLNSLDYVFTAGALTGNQGIQLAEAGAKAIYVSGWQVAADNNQAGHMYPDLGLYPSNSTSDLVAKIVKALQRADQIQHLENRPNKTDYFLPIVADGEAGFGGPLHAFELMKAMIEAGAAGVHFEDQSPGERRCGHLGGKVLVPTKRFISILTAARLAADVAGVPAVLIARTDSIGAQYLTSDADPTDKKFLTGKRTAEGYFEVEAGLEMAIERGLAYAPYADLLWFETSSPSLEEAKRFADAIHSKYPGKLLAYNMSPSFNWTKVVDAEELSEFNKKLGQMGYKFQFITLAGFHTLNASLFELAKKLVKEGMKAYAEFQGHEMELEKAGYRALKHQRFVGVHYYDAVLTTIEGMETLTALAESTETAQFK